MQGRLIIDERGDAAWNMAVDQTLLESVSAGGPPVLRFYRWAQPTLSLGYFQSLSDRQQHVASRDAVVVRRSSGGGAILHDHELTYSLVLPIRDRTSARVQKYVEIMHQAIAGACSDANIPLVRVGDRATAPRDPAFLCFQRRSSDDLECAGYKVVGSAQRRAAHAVLQHGSMLLAASDKAPELPGICDLVGRNIEVEDWASAIQRWLRIGLTEVSQWSPATLTGEQIAAADRTAKVRFANPTWLGRRP
ncbi:lipoate--protein ligase family protein [Roseimaritima ulvae]|uniref:Octanoyltransferase LipM n=1 Tax=Roseimaritima ulvae TaxID=980254 RepID=A0A5B9QZQ3_9BACT|nr:biotin/lipoate A/B protein ligase family protein [Roseimaritima ulvae]QEG42915.1 Octanoyltransferase LipM [Roseimaritima ulvae]